MIRRGRLNISSEYPRRHAFVFRREYYGLLERLGATRVPGVLHEAFLNPMAWEALSVSGIVKIGDSVTCVVAYYNKYVACHFIAAVHTRTVQQAD